MYGHIWGECGVEQENALVREVLEAFKTAPYCYYYYYQSTMSYHFLFLIVITVLLM